MNSPWGHVQHVKEVAEGIQFLSTSSHGGFKLSAERFAQIPARFRGLNTYGGGRFFEEDCEVNLVILSFPDLFPGQAERAELVARSIYPSAFTGKNK